MGAVIALIVLSLLCKIFLFAQYNENAFTIHDTFDSAVNIYYDTEMVSSQIICSIYPDYEYKVWAQSHFEEWVKEGNPMCGVELTVMSEADNDCFFVILGSVYGYIKRGSVAVLTRNPAGEPLYLYESNSKESKSILIGYVKQWAQILGKKGDWFYVRLLGTDFYGWLPPDMQCASFKTTCC